MLELRAERLERESKEPKQPKVKDFSSNIEVKDLVIKPNTKVQKVNRSEAEQLKIYRFYLEGFKTGTPTSQLVADCMEKFGMSRETAHNWRDRALDALSHYMLRDVEQIRAVQLERLEHIYNLSVQARQYKTAQSILDTMNKVMGLYKDSTVIVQPVTEFKFGDDKQIIVNPYQNELDGVKTPEEINAKAGEILDDYWGQDNS